MRRRRGGGDTNLDESKLYRRRLLKHFIPNGAAIVGDERHIIDLSLKITRNSSDDHNDADTDIKLLGSASSDHPGRLYTRSLCEC